MTSEVMSHLHAVATTRDAGQRLDHFLARQLPQLSRSQIQRLIREGHVQVAGARPKASLVVWDGLSADVAVPAPEPLDLRPEALPLSILYDDDSLVVIDKPAGMVVHPAAGHARGTLVHALLHHVGGLSGIGGRERPGIVHRLDRGTSGVMIIAKTDAAHRSLAQQFHDRQVEKDYMALVWGNVSAGLVIEKPIGRHPTHRQKMSTRAPGGRAAVTRVIDTEPLGGVTLVRVTIATGRTHQIRVHLADAGHPVAGDALYGGVRRRLPARLAALARLERPFLHAARLRFSHPETGRRLTFDAPLPPDLTDVLTTLRRSSS